MTDETLEQIQTALDIALQADLEHGVAWMNDEASVKFRHQYPTLSRTIFEILEMEVDDD